MNKDAIDYLLKIRLISRNSFAKKMGIQYSDVFEAHDEAEEKAICKKASSVLNVSEEYLNSNFHLGIINRVGNFVILLVFLVFTFEPFARIYIWGESFITSFCIDCVLLILNVFVYIIFRKFLLRHLLLIPFFTICFFMGFNVLMFFYS